ncbi:MAG: sugar phosphate isomerase/epimerase [Bryobacteraceae bacterium]
MPIRRRQFLTSVTGTALLRGVGARAAQSTPEFPKLSMITRYSPERVAFAASAGYEGVEIALDEKFDPDHLTDSQIDQAVSAARNAGIRLVGIESMFGVNHIHRDPAKRRAANARFVRSIELAHRLGSPFAGTFSGAMPGAPLEEQAKAFAGVINEQYVPVLEKLNVKMGWENYPYEENFATTPAAWKRVLALVPNRRVGLEFDPSHLVRQFIDPVKAAWEFRDRIVGFHAKDTEIVQPVLQEVGIHGKDWWRYRIPGQGLIDWPKVLNALLEARYTGAVSVEHEDPFWDEPGGDAGPELGPARKRGFVLAARFLRQYLPEAPR